MSLTHLPAMRYRLSATLERPLVLPPYPGSMLRGAFGHALQQLACHHPPGQCESRAASDPCRFRQLFSPQADRPLTLAVTGQLPPPYLITPLHWPSRGAVQSLEFNLVLFGMARDDLMLIIQSWQRALANGLGKARVKGQLQQVVAELPEGEKRVYRHGALRLESHRQHYTIPQLEALSRVQLVFNSPLRLQNNGRVVSAQALTPRRFVSALLRRLTLMMEAHAVPHPIAAADLLQQADRLEHQHTLNWFDWQRYSNRQKKEMTLGGLLGSWHWQGDLAPLWPYLWAGQIVHAGKETVFGMGGYRLLTQ